MRQIILALIISTNILFAPRAEANIVVHDFRGKELVLKKPAERVICLIESALTGIYMLQQKNKIIGVPNNVYEEGFYYKGTFAYYALLDERIKNKAIPAVGNWETVNLEKLISLKPDLVIIWASQSEAISTLERLGIPVYGVFVTKIEDVYKEIIDFGNLLDSSTRAKQLVSYARDQVSGIKETACNIRSHKRVYFSWAQMNFLQTSCNGSIVNELIDIFGGKNVCSDIKGESVTLNIEKLIAFNPDTIFLWYSKSLTPKDIIQMTSLKTLNAVKNKTVYQFSDTFSYDLWTLKFIYALKFMAQKTYPNLFNYNMDDELNNTMKILYKTSFPLN